VEVLILDSGFQADIFGDNKKICGSGFLGSKRGKIFAKSRSNHDRQRVSQIGTMRLII
jgi:hypothetical protein